MITCSRPLLRAAALAAAVLLPLALGGCVVYPAYPPGPHYGYWYGGGGGGWHRGY
ncbi:hypothetical protein [Rhodopila sp.]|jgi:hypothetical protein|uniref:hypothetical protein n=1 Tax=Rhodopila sp. TaxID=2480087 RepID=UPI002C214EB5|nr:hypothetical protein [Rhodopila sp.]HVZ10336.1 hypothetical protein [Rhodopila sp.]